MLNLLLLSDKKTGEVIFKTISHVYPELKIDQIKFSELTKKKGDLLVVDTKVLAKDKLEDALSQLPEAHFLVIADEVSASNKVSHLLSSRGEFVLREELSTNSLVRIINHLLERQRLHEQLRKAAFKIKDISIHDDLTHLYNHHHFNEILSQEIKKAKRYKRSMSLVMLDLKNFSNINEVFGQEEGDKILVRIAEVIGRTIRESDIAARFGDNTFAVILPEANMEAALRARERLCDALSDITGTQEGKSTKISIAAGVATLEEGAKTKDCILKSALAELAASKKDGSLCANGVNHAERDLRENRKLVGELHERFLVAGEEAERGAFQAVVNIIKEISLQRRHIMSHLERVAFYAKQLATRVEEAKKMADCIYRAGFLHDIGKLAINDDILNRKEKLTQEERKLLQQHSSIGAQMIMNVPFLSREANLIVSHHERFDGKGYPSGLKEEEIPMGSRIIGLTEAWDVMVTPQPYRDQPLTLDGALSELTKGAGKQFDPYLVEIFTALITS